MPTGCGSTTSGTGTVGAPPAITDTDWHDVRVGYWRPTGAIAVYVDRAVSR